MSSSDDEHEKELLQKALQEQAQRDVRYKRELNVTPPVISSATAASLVQHAAGALTRQSLNVPPGRDPPKLHHVDEEEESDVELLSISSEDEDGLERERDPGPVSITAREEDSDLEWNAEDEPDKWKRVDEAELVWRVRELRQTRSATLTNQAYLQRATAFSRKATMFAETFSSGEDFMDPLGLGVIDTKTLTLVKHGSHSPCSSSAAFVKGGGRKGSLARRDDGTTSFPQIPALQDHVLREKVMYHSESFDPMYFLRYVHQNTRASDLETGGQALKMDLQNRKQQLKHLVKENFDCFVSCKNTIDDEIARRSDTCSVADIHSKLQQIEEDPRGAGTSHLSNSINAVDKVATRAFGPLFERQVQAERIRSVQGMLQRFRTLFNLPSAIRSNVSKGEYDLAVREYRKAKSIVLPTHAGILRRVLEEVDAVFQEFKDKLYKSMEDPQLEFCQLENTIHLILELEPESDPVWYCLNIQSRRIHDLQVRCCLKHEVQMVALHDRLKEKIQSDARWKQLQQECSKAAEVDYSLLLGEQENALGEMHNKVPTVDESDALLCQLICWLTSVIMQHVPPFWQLAVAIFSGKFAKGASGNRSFELPCKCNVETSCGQKGADVKCNNHSLDEVVPMVVSMISLYKSKILNTFVKLTEFNVLRPYMRMAVEEISKACLALQSRDFAPSSAVIALFSLRTEIVQVFVLRLCSFMRTATLDIVNEEDWIPVSTIDRGGSEFAISALVLRFRNMLAFSLQHIKEMIDKLKADGSEQYDVNVQVCQMQDSVRSTFFECFLLLKESLKKTSDELSKHSQLIENEGTGNGKMYAAGEQFIGLQSGVEVGNPHQKLLMILSNISYCKSVLLPNMSQKYKCIWTTPSKEKGADDDEFKMDNEISDSYTTLEETILGQYTYAKAALIGTTAAAYLLEDGVQWWAAPPVKGIRDAAVELLHPLIVVHAEVYSGSKPFLEKAISILIEALMEALWNVLSENKSKALRILDCNGFCQLILEMDYVETVIQSYMTTAAKETSKLIRDLLRQKVLESVNEIEALGYRRSTQDGLGNRLLNPSMTSEEIVTLEQQVGEDFLPTELKRTRLNTICFMDANSQSEVGSDVDRQWPSVPSASVAGSILLHCTGNSSGVGLFKHGRYASVSSFSDSDSGKPAMALPNSLYHQSGSASSDMGSEASSGDIRRRRLTNNERFMKGQPGGKQYPKKTHLGISGNNLI